MSNSSNFLVRTRCILALITLPLILGACAWRSGASAAATADSATASRVACAPGSNCTVATAQGASISTTDVFGVRGGVPMVKPVDVGALFAKVPDDTTGFYFMRPSGPANTEPYNIFVDTKYVASLHPGTWSYVELCPGEHILQVISEADALIDKTRAPSLRVKVDGGTAYFVEVQNPTPQGFVRLNANQAAQSMRTAGRAVHTIPRLPGRSCAKSPAVVAMVGNNLLRYEINSDILFDFDRSDINQRNVRQATAVLRSIILDIKQRNVLIEAMDIQGYTDPQGSPAYNQALSLRRATTVAQFFQKSGAPSKRLRTLGMGERDLVIRNCASMVNKSQREACDHPNRRVEIVVHTRPKEGSSEASTVAPALAPRSTTAPATAQTPRSNRP